MSSSTPNGTYGLIQKKVSLQGLMVATGTIVCGFTVAGFFAEESWLLDLTSHFRVQYASVLLFLAVLLALRRESKWTLAFTLFALINASAVVPLYFTKSEKNGIRSGTRLRLVTLNVHTENMHFEAVQKFLRDVSPDLILLMEVNQRWLKELSELRETHPYNLAQPQDDNFGIALFSRFPLREPEIISLGSADVPSVTAKLLIGTNIISAIGTHPLPPGSSQDAQFRNQQLAETAALARAEKTPVVVLGDLNVTPWSPYFRRLLRDSGLQNTAQGHGIQASWPTFLPPLRIPIDHILVSRDFRVIRRSLGPKVGSDHFPIVLDLALP